MSGYRFARKFTCVAQKKPCTEFFTLFDDGSQFFLKKNVFLEKKVLIGTCVFNKVSINTFERIIGHIKIKKICDTKNHRNYLTTGISFIFF